MASISFVLGFLPILAAGASFQDGLAPRDFQDKIVARVPQADNGALICSAIGGLFSACDINASMQSTDAASCLCYSDATWVPSIFDDGVSSCADYASTALPATDYSLVSEFEGFCTLVGDYQNSPSPAASPTSPVHASSTPIVPAGSITSPLPTPIATTKPAAGSASASVDIFTNSDCSYLSFALSFCNSATPGFSTIDPSSKAPCLCYSSTKWSPNGFDGPVKTCAEYVSTADPAAYTDIAAIEGFCSSVGDVFADATGTGAAATATAKASGGSGSGIGLSVPAGAKTTAPTTKAPSVTTTPKATTPVASPSPAVTTIKNGDAALPLDSSMSWAFRLVFVAVSVMVLL